MIIMGLAHGDTRHQDRAPWLQDNMEKLAEISNT
jgi:hypothetical protein